jgi:hypothetical protein
MRIAAAAHADSGNILSTLLSYWWLLALFGGGVLEGITGTFSTGIAALRGSSRRRHKRRLELKRLELQIVQARAGGCCSCAGAAPPQPAGPGAE